MAKIYGNPITLGGGKPNKYTYSVHATYDDFIHMKYSQVESDSFTEWIPVAKSETQITSSDFLIFQIDKMLAMLQVNAILTDDSSVVISSPITTNFSDCATTFPTSRGSRCIINVRKLFSKFKENPLKKIFIYIMD